MQIYSMIEADKRMLSGHTYPASVCRLIMSYITNIIRFPIPVYLGELDETGYWNIKTENLKQIGICKSIKFDQGKFVADVEVEGIENPNDYYLDLPLYGEVQEISYVIKRFIRMDNFIYINRLQDYENMWRKDANN